MQLWTIKGDDLNVSYALFSLKLGKQMSDFSELDIKGGKIHFNRNIMNLSKRFISK